MFAKGATFLLQAVLVVGAVLAFSFFDPFNIFNTKKLRMTDTSLILESTKEIGELITAEFYGEVLVGSQESYVANYDTLTEAAEKVLDNIHGDFQAAVEKIKPGIFPNWKKLYAEFEGDNSVLMNHADYQEYWEMLKTRTERDEPHKILRRAKNDGKWWNWETEEIAKWYVKLRYSVEENASRQRRRQRLIMLGRGWVRAGIDFSNFSENAFDYDSDKGLLKLYGNQPKILSASINPWLSPEEGIPGWEIVEVNGKAKKKGGPELVKEVKTTGLNKLKQQAEAAGILDKAVENAEVNLSGFFSLLLDKDVTVRIYANTLDAYLADFGEAFEREEIIAASEIIRTHLDHLPEVFDFYDSLTKLPQSFVDTFDTNTLQPLHYRAIALRLTENTILDETDLAQIDSLRNQEPTVENLFYQVALDTLLYPPLVKVIKTWTWEELLAWYIGEDIKVPNAFEKIEGWDLLIQHREELDLTSAKDMAVEKLDAIVRKQRLALPLSAPRSQSADVIN